MEASFEDNFSNRQQSNNCDASENTYRRLSRSSFANKPQQAFRTESFENDNYKNVREDALNNYFKNASFSNALIILKSHINVLW